MVTAETSREILEEFLSVPLNSGDALFERFAQLPGAVCSQGSKPLERYVYVPGSRKDRIVLVAHTDTVWDNAYNRPMETSVIFEDGVFKGTNPDCGIGADDRAGCAMLWALRDSGHSLLLVDGEEHGKIGARYLRKSDPKLFRTLNRHRFMLEMDWQGTGTCLYNQVDYTKRFQSYITDKLGFSVAPKGGGCDLQFLCHRICGTNVGVGYHGIHRSGETLVLSEWENTLSHLRAFLAESHPEFPVSRIKRLRKFPGKVKGKLMSLLKKAGIQK